MTTFNTISTHIVKSAAFAAVIYGFATRHKTTHLTEADDDNQPKGLGLGVKVSVICGFIGIICVIPVAIYSANNLHQIAADNGMEKLSLAAVNTSRAVDSNRRQINDELKAIAENGSFNRNRSSLARLGKDLLEADSGYLSLSYINANTGKVVTRFETGGEFGIAALNRDAIQESEAKLLSQIMAGYNTASITRSRVSVLEGGLDEASGVPVEGTAVAVYRSGIESPVGVLVAHNDLSAALKPQQVQNTDARLYVVNSAGQVLIGLEGEETADNTIPALEALFPGIEFVEAGANFAR